MVDLLSFFYKRDNCCGFLFAYLYTINQSTDSTSRSIVSGGYWVHNLERECKTVSFNP